ncbi:MAG: hypothetical protein EPN82_03035 [Bacteroidetes bacterium]|nr:MAG: hypothetical protein EPN82_03035 [Bacteroidota bacterium]
MRQLILILCIGLLIVISSCSKQQEKIATEPSFKVLEFKKASFPSSLVYKGSVVQGLHWSDKNGDNYFLLTEENTSEKYDSTNDWNYKTKFWHGYHFANYNQTEYKLLREFTDFVKDCEFDLMQEFLADYFTVTDLDKNNLGEVTVIYTKTCTSDVSPQDIILLMFENGTKYAIRGLTNVDVPGLSIKGERKVDASFNSAVPVLKEYAITQFNRAAGIK